MSLMHGHIKSHRAMAAALRTQVDHLRIEKPADHAISSQVLCCIADAHEDAAADLERQEWAILETIRASDP